MVTLAVVCFIFAVKTIFAEDVDVLRKVACDNTDMMLKCDENQLLKIYLASYGKFESDYCHKYGSKPVKHCQADRNDTFSIIHSRCDRRKSCQVPVTSLIFGNPCPHISKYLEVVYECAEASFYTKLACQRHPMSIKCPNNSTIWISNAFYGRNDPDKCRINRLGSDQIQTYDCESLPRVTQVVGERCNGLKECNIVAATETLGNPCVGTYKYLEVNYQCIMGHYDNVPDDDEYPYIL